MAYSRFESARQTSNPTRLSVSFGGSPVVSCFHVVPPSVDLNTPLVGPRKSPFSHGPCRAAHSAA